MKRMNLLSLVVGLGAILASGIALADDVVSIGVLPGSSINVHGNVLSFGTDPPTSTFNNVLIADDGTVFVAQNDISFAPIDVNVGGVVVQAQLRAQSDLIGTYDRNTGSVTATVDVDLKITGFLITDTCIIPTTTLNLSTDNLGGSACSGGNCNVIDNTFVVDAIPTNACGFFTEMINNQLGLPSLTPGDNTLKLVIRMTPPLDP